MTEDGGPPRFARVLVRALVFVMPGLADLRPDPLDHPPGVWVHGPDSPIRVGLTVDVVELVVVALLFATARRANGLADQVGGRARTVWRSLSERARLVPAV